MQKLLKENIKETERSDITLRSFQSLMCNKTLHLIKEI